MDNKYKILVKAESPVEVHNVEATVNAKDNTAILDAVKELITTEVSTLSSAVKIDIQINKIIT